MILTIVFVFVLLETSVCVSSTPEIQFDLPTESKIDHKLLRRSSFRYLADVYKYEVAKENGDTRIKREISSSVEALEKSDSVMSFHSEVMKVYNGILGKNSSLLVFHNLEKISNETIIGAELRVFQKRIDICENFTVTVYSVDLKQQKLECVSSVNTTGNYTGWLSFNITSLSDVFYSKKELLLTITPTKIEEDHQQSNRIIKSPIISDDEETNPFLITYMKKVEPLQLFKHRNVSQNKESRLRPQLPNVPQTIQNKTSGKCQLHKMFVPFKDLNWEDWIIAPRGFEGNYCAGHCPYPLPEEMNSSNHAVIQSLMHQLHPDSIPELCCVPTKLKPIITLYLLDSDVVVLKKYKDMVVTGCQCV